MTWPLPALPFPTYGSEGWLLDEDRALRDLMKNMMVSDHESGGKTRRVEAWFGHPDQELREQTYPYVTVDLLGIDEGRERVHRGDYLFTEADSAPWWGLDPLTGKQAVYVHEMPTPVDLSYQISTWARNPRHDRQILAQMITGGRTMLRGGLLYVGDNTIRRLDYLGHIKRDTVESGKRLFNNVFRIRVSSQVPWGIVDRAWSEPGLPLVNRVDGSVEWMSDGHTPQSLGSYSNLSAVVTGWDATVRLADVRLDNDDSVLTGIPVTRILNPTVGDRAVVMRDFGGGYLLVELIGA